MGFRRLPKQQNTTITLNITDNHEFKKQQRTKIHQQHIFKR